MGLQAWQNRRRCQCCSNCMYITCIYGIGVGNLNPICWALNQTRVSMGGRERACCLVFIHSFVAWCNVFRWCVFHDWSVQAGIYGTLSTCKSKGTYFPIIESFCHGGGVQVVSLLIESHVMTRPLNRQARAQQAPAPASRHTCPHCLRHLHNQREEAVRCTNTNNAIVRTFTLGCCAFIGLLRFGLVW